MRRCPRCQAAYDDEVVFCPEDGAELAGNVDDLLGTTVGAWLLIERLGGGAMGSVYLGQHPTIKSKVAIKLLHRRFSQDPVATGRFNNEARAANLIGHDNIVKVIDLGQTADGQHFMVMEFLEGETLDKFIRRRKPVPFVEGADIGLQCCSGLQAAHERGIIHRDLKPENIFLTNRDGQDNFVKLLDFGVAKLDEKLGSTVKTRDGTTLGTPWYMSPEQAMGTPVDPRSDVYSLGIILYEMAVGRVPFPEKEVTSSMVAHVQHKPPPLRGLVPEVTPQYEAAILKTLAKDPRNRHQTMIELRDDIERCLRGAPRPKRAAPPKRSKKMELSSEPMVQQAAAPPPRARRASAAAAEVVPTVYLPNAHLRPSWQTGALIALGAVTVGALLIGLLVRSRKHRVPAATIEAPLVDTKNTAQPRQDGPQALPTMTVKSDPAGAQVKASWPGGSLMGVTPFTFVAPRGAAVHLEYTLAGHQPGAMDLVLDQPKLAEMQMRKGTSPQVRKGLSQRRTRPAGDPRTTTKELDETVPIADDFGDDSFKEKK